MDSNQHESAGAGAPSPWVIRFGEKIVAQGSVLDVACGRGRHAQWFAARGHAVTAVDRDAMNAILPGVTFIEADIETGPWLFAGQTFDCVVVTNYLHRPHFPHLLAAVKHGGWLIYETFAVGNEQYGRPTRPDFLLKPGELLEVVCATHGTFEIAAYEHGYMEFPKPAVVQRIAAWRAPL